MNIGEKIKMLRKAHNMTQEELASKIGIAANSLHRYEHGTRNISCKMLEKIASVFGMSIEEVMHYNGSKEADTVAEAEIVTKEVYREYLCTRMKQLTEHMMNLPAGNDTLKLHLEIQRDMDFVMQQLWIIDNGIEE